MNTNVYSNGRILNFAETAAEKIGYVQEGAAEFLDSAASAIRSTAFGMADTIEKLGEGGASRLDSAASLIRSFSPASSMENAIRQNPGMVWTAGIAGALLVGLTMHRRRAVG